MSRSRPQVDKSMQQWNIRDDFVGRSFDAAIGNDFCNGHRGMAKAARGAKRFVNSRRRFHERMTLARLDLTDD